MDTGIGIRGRKPKLVRVDGQVMEFHKGTRFGTSTAVFLPRAWVIAVEGKGRILGYALSYNGSVLTIKPYYAQGEGDSGDKH